MIKHIILSCLYSLAQGRHFGTTPTYQKIKGLLYWKGLKEDIKKFIWRCEACAQNKYDNVVYQGPLQPLPIPKGVWQSLSMGFIDPLPKFTWKDTIWVAVDGLSKYANSIPLSHPYTAYTIAVLFINRIYKLCGTPLDIVSGRDPIFISNFW